MTEHEAANTNKPDLQAEIIGEIIGTLGGAATAQEAGTPESAREEGYVHPSLKAFFAQEAAEGGSRNPYFFVEPDGTTRPRDPVTGEVLYAGDIPPSLLMDADMRRGFAFWREHGSDAQLRLLLVHHESHGDLARSGVDLNEIARQLAADDGILFIEGIDTGADAAEGIQIYQSVAFAGPDRVDEYQTLLNDVRRANPSSGFLVEVGQALLGTGVRVQHADVLTDSDIPVDVAATELWAYAESIPDDGTLESQVEYARALLATDYYRDMYIIGRLGHTLSLAYEQTGRIPPAAKLVGALHENIGHWLEERGVRVTFEGGSTSVGLRAQVAMLRKATLEPEDYAKFEQG